MRVISYGGGVQSTALLVLAAHGRIDFRTLLFSNVGDDSENPATLAYFREVAVPYARAHRLDLIELSRIRRDGSAESLMQQLERPDSRSLPIPVRMSNGAPGRRSCTSDFKIKVVDRWLREHGATPEAPATVGIGISVDEIHRANRRRRGPHEIVTYPLLDLHMRRDTCVDLIAAEGLPVPPKSSCYFCPFQTVGSWKAMRASQPELFGRAVDLEALLNDRRDQLGKDHVYLTRYGKPLDQAIPSEACLPEADGDHDPGCDSGWCMT